jgi:cytochrome c-type biogenesis protein CcmH
VTRRLLPWLALAAVVVVMLAIVVWPSGGKPSAAERARSIGSELRCPDCESQSIAQSSTGTARAARADIRQRIAAGQSDADIRQAYIDKFGDSILLKPSSGGLGILVWGLPVVVLVLGGGGLVLALRRWRREPHLHPTDADRELVQQARPVQ